MNPILLRVPLGEDVAALGAYGTFYLLAWLLAPAVGVWVAARRGLPLRRVAAVYYGALLAGVVGARVLDLFVAGGFYADDPARMWSLNVQGFSLYGGFAVASIAAIVLARALELPAWRLADSAVPAIVTGVVLMRIGCYLRGCCFGTVTDAVWGVRFPVGSPAWNQQALGGQTGLIGALTGAVLPVHPTQLYELVAALALGALAMWLSSRRVPDGVPFLVFAIGFTAFRLSNGFLRANVVAITAPTWFYPVLYCGVIAVLVALLVRRLRSGAGDGPFSYP